MSNLDIENKLDLTNRGLQTIAERLKTGKIERLAVSVSGIEKELFSASTHEMNYGYGLNTYGTYEEREKRCATENYIKVKSGDTVSVSDGWLFNIAQYSEPDKFPILQYRGFSSDTFTVDVDSYIRIGMRYGDGTSEFDVADAQKALTVNADGRSRIQIIEDAVQEQALALDDKSDRYTYIGVYGEKVGVDFSGTGYYSKGTDGRIKLTKQAGTSWYYNAAFIDLTGVDTIKFNYYMLGNSHSKVIITDDEDVVLFEIAPASEVMDFELEVEEGYKRLYLNHSLSVTTTRPANVWLGKNEKVEKYALSSRVDAIEKKVRPPKMKFGAHQGARMKAPQNSIPAYEIAGKDGWEYVWIAKVRRSADGVYYVMHDADVSTTTNGTGIIEELSSSYIDTLIINEGNFVSSYDESELHVAKLEDVIQICNMYGMGICFRLDAFPYNRDTEADAKIWNDFAEIVRSYSCENAIFSTEYGKMENIPELFGDGAEVNLYMTAASTPKDMLDKFTEKGMLGKNLSALVHISVLDLDGVKLLHKNGIKVYAYDNAPTEEQLLNACKWGVDIFQNAVHYRLPQF